MSQFEQRRYDAAMFAGHGSTLLLLAGLALAAFFLLRNSAGLLARGRKQEADPRGVRKLLGEPNRDAALADAPPEVLRWQVEMHETARDLKAEIDTKLAALQAITIAARQERERLEETLRRAEAADNSSPSRSQLGA